MIINRRSQLLYLSRFFSNDPSVIILGLPVSVALKRLFVYPSAIFLNSLGNFPRSKRLVFSENPRSFVDCETKNFQVENGGVRNLRENAGLKSADSQLLFKFKKVNRKNEVRSKLGRVEALRDCFQMIDLWTKR